MKIPLHGRRFAPLLLLALALLAGDRCGAAAGSDDESKIARVTATLLEQSHFSSHRAHGDLSGKFLDRYLDMLDPAHTFFLQSDVEEFAPFRTTLEELTLKTGDTSPARKIFDRFLQRLDERVAFVQDQLKTAKFDFSPDEKYMLDREHAPRPADLVAAKDLWRQHLRYEYLQEKLGKKKPEEIVTTLTKRYERTQRTMKKFTDDQVFEVYLNALAHVYDPHSDYMGRRQLEDFSISMSLSLFGIGAVLQSEDGYCKIRELMPGGPAATSKLLKPGDRIVSVAQDGKEPVDIIEMPLTEAVPMIRGAKGTKVTLTFIPADATDSAVRKTITLVRDEIKLENQEAKARVVDLPGFDGKSHRLGVIDLPSFYTGAEGRNTGGHGGATADVAKLIEKLKKEKVQGIILDLRRNGGGSLEEAITLSGLFIEYGPIVQTKDADGKVTVERDRDSSVLYDGPLVVLTSRLSASASEILAGALQDYERALVVGDPSTFGKGTVQSMIQLAPLMHKFGMDAGENPGALKLTIRKFYRPGGSSTQLKGVVPDLVLPSAVAQLKVGESEMPESLPWDEVPPARHTNFNSVAFAVPALRQKSAERLTTDQDFAWLREDIERFKQHRDQPVSLNEQQRVQEKNEQEARDEARKKARTARKPSAQTQYEITLKNADAAGLPAPMTFAATSTNATVAVAHDTTDHADDADLTDVPKDDKDPTADITLEETKRILADYIDQVALSRPKSAAENSKQSATPAR